MIRRLVASLACTLALSGLAPMQAPASSSPPASAATRVVLLGTGAGPTARSTRSQPATLVEVDGKNYLIDSGEGVIRQLAAAGVQPGAIDGIFITHLHFDHTAGLPALMAFAWQDRRRAPVPIYGPPGTEALVRDALRTLESSADIFRAEQPGLPPLPSLFRAHDVVANGVTEIFRDASLRVTAVANSHYATMKLPRRSYGEDRSYSYRIDTADRSIVFTGDTGPSAAVQQLARGADVLVSEVIDLPAIVARLRQRATATGVDQSELIAHMVREHLTPDEVGKLAAGAGVRRVVLTHIASPPRVEADVPSLVAGVRAHFAGDVTAGTDLYSF